MSKNVYDKLMMTTNAKIGQKLQENGYVCVACTGNTAYAEKKRFYYEGNLSGLIDKLEKSTKKFITEDELLEITDVKEIQASMPNPVNVKDAVSKVGNKKL